MQPLMKTLILTILSPSSLAMVFNPQDLLGLGHFLNPGSTCSKMDTTNSHETCPQTECYGDSSCCHPTGVCSTFSASLCADISTCTDGPCGFSSSDITSGFPNAAPSLETSYHSEVDGDGCVCAKAADTCTTLACWGEMACTGEGSCKETGLCQGGDDIAKVGDFCVVLADSPRIFKFCAEPPMTTNIQNPTSVPTPERRPDAIPVPRHGRVDPDVTTTTTTLCDTISCQIFNDPHINGFNSMEDGPASLRRTVSWGLLRSSTLRSSSFEGHPMYFDVGDAWLIKSELLSVQGRYVPSTAFKTGGAVMGAIAVSGPALHGKRLIVGPRNESLTWDGLALPFGAFTAHLSRGDLTVLNGENGYGSERPFNRVEVYLPMNISFTINRYDYYLNVKITMPKVGFITASNVEGQCVHYHGAGEDDVLSETERRMHTSYVSQKQSLFD